VILIQARRFLADAATAILGLFIVGVLGLCFIGLLIASAIFPPSARLLKPKGKP
jgi:hypothetical protein